MPNLLGVRDVARPNLLTYQRAWGLLIAESEHEGNGKEVEKDYLGGLLLDIDLTEVDHGDFIADEFDK